MPHFDQTLVKTASLSAEQTAARNKRIGINAALILAWLAVVATLGGDAILNIREILTATSFGPQGRLVEPFVFSSGEHTRNLVIPSAPDGRWWIMNAERMARTGQWRVRETDSDNAPDGREVHWSSLPAWNLVALGKLLSPWNPRPDLSEIEWAALFVGPLTLLLFLIAAMVLGKRAFGTGAATALPLSILAASSLQYFFRAGEADHHGLVSMFAMLGVLLLVSGRLGFRRTDGEHPSRTWFVWAGTMSASGLWISAATQVPIIAATAASALLASWMQARQYRESLDPFVWRIWGIAGGAVSIFFYMLEYFPSHMGWRLEVNHPVYALAWAAGGEMLCRAVLWMKDGRCPVGNVRTAICAGAMALVVLSPLLLIIAGGEHFFVISDRFLYALHDYFINEFQSVLDVWKGTGFHYALFAFSLSLAAAAIAALAVTKTKPAAGDIAVIAFAAGPALVMTALACHQIRWAGVATAMTIPLVLACFAALQNEGSSAAPWRSTLAWLLLLLAAATGPASVISRFADWPRSGNFVDKSQVPSVLARDISQRIATAGQGSQPVILASPSLSTDLIYYGGAKGLGTLYWENLAGLQAGAQIYSTKDEQRALSLIKKHGITHMIFCSWDSFGQRYARLDRGLGKEDEARDGFIAGLLEGTRPQPTWLNPLWYPIPKEYELGDDQWIRIYEVVPEQTRAQWLYKVGIYQLDAGKSALAERSFRESLSLDPRGVPQRMALIMLLAARGESGEVKTQMAALMQADPQHGAQLLEDAATQLDSSGQTMEAAILRAGKDRPGKK